MFSHSFARLSASLPSSIKYRLASLRPFYAGLMRLGEPLVKAHTIAGSLNWSVDKPKAKAVTGHRTPKSK